MAGDHAPEAIVEGALAASEAGLPVVLVGDAARIESLLPASSGIVVVHSDDAIRMDAAPASVRNAETSSIRVAMGLVASGEASSVMSCGHSGATFIAAVIDLGVLDGIERPAIGTALPRTDGGDLYVLDVGATLDCRAEHLESFAVLGVAWARAMGIEEPRVGLLSIGHEAQKGNQLVRAARELISALPIRFVGNLEPDAAFNGACDVLVCDGFTGNIMLKTAEGLVHMVEHLVRDEISSSRRAMAGAWLMRPAMRRLAEVLDWRSRGGALLVGARAPVVVGHGRADAAAACAAIRLAHYASEGRLVDEVRARLAPSLSG